jgi:hypothetical protein
MNPKPLSGHRKAALSGSGERSALLDGANQRPEFALVPRRAVADERVLHRSEQPAEFAAISLRDHCTPDDTAAIVSCMREPASPSRADVKLLASLTMRSVVRS